MRKSNSTIKELIKGFKFVHSLSKRILAVTVLDAFLSSVVPFINLVMSTYIIDALIRRAETDELVRLVGMTVAVNFVIFVSSKFTSLWKLRCQRVMSYNCDMAINSKIMSMDYSAVEDPKTHALRKKIEEYENMNSGGAYQMMYSFSNAMESIFSIILALVMMPALFINSELSGWFITAGFIGMIFLSMGVSIWIQSLNAKKLYGFFGEVMDVNRIYGYYMDHVSDYNSGKGIRIYHQESLLLGCVSTFVNKYMKSIFDRLGNSSALMMGISTIFSSLSTGLIFIFVALKATTGAIAASGVLKYIGGIMQLMKGLEGMVRSLFEIMNNFQYLQDYYDFFEIESTMYRGTLPVEKRDDDAYEIAFKNVSFKYPGSDVYSLKNVNLTLQIGERMAIVGMNGSGKTTLIKLLCRLYDPTEGVITLNGIDIKKYDYEEYLELFSVVFQDFKLFSFSLGQNVGTTTQYDTQKVHTVLDQVGMNDRVEKMAKGLETYLYKYFDVTGEELSGGEGQKVALARAIYRDAPMVILDEPTSALDPIAEFEIYSKFNDIVKTKTAFYISHRLSSCRFCDSIAVFHEGELVQRGHHETLLAQQDGKYRELWLAQAQYYSDEAC